MSEFGALLHRLRQSAGLSQRALAQRAGTSQPAVARYEGGAATPSWETAQRLAESCGRRLRIGVETVPDAHDIELAERLLELTPAERLRALSRYTRLHALARGHGE
jgi:transcriptional regulator with XRE-family HTH domain